jgi:hypothetical protein
LLYCEAGPSFPRNALESDDQRVAMLAPAAPGLRQLRVIAVALRTTGILYFALAALAWEIHKCGAFQASSPKSILRAGASWPFF